MGENGTLPNEAAAEYRTNIEGWVCKTCRRFYGKEEGAERTARYCCEKDHQCDTKGCQNRAPRSRIYCPMCDSKRDLERYLKMEEVDWDGETPLVEDDNDQFFFSADDLREHLEQEDIKLEDMRLVICVVEDPPYFDLNDFLSDHLPDSLDADDPAKLEKYVNKWIEKHVPKVWTSGKQRPSLKSLQGNLETVEG